jgi:hypothetical protein
MITDLVRVDYFIFTVAAAPTCHGGLHDDGPDPGPRELLCDRDLQ